MSSLRFRAPRPAAGRAARATALAVVVLVAAALTACSVTVTRAAASDSLRLVAFAGARAANAPVQDAWGAQAHDDVAWLTSFGASGDQARALGSGLPADVVHLSLPSDMEPLVKAGLVDGDRTAIATRSVVVLVVRDGNPKGITGWQDLARDDISIITPNPGSSGAARWNIVAAYGAALESGESRADAETFLTALFRNVASLPASGRDATTAFVAGSADVLISQEQEAIFARANGAEVDYIVPATTLLVENPASVTIGADPRAANYLDYLLGPAGQRLAARAGFRPAPGTDLGKVAVPGAADPALPFPVPENLLTVDADFGGWDRLNSQLFNSGGIVAQIQQEVGSS